MRGLLPLAPAAYRLLAGLAFAVAPAAAEEVGLAGLGPGGTLLLADGREVVLAGVLLPAAEDGPGAAALAARAEGALSDLLRGQGLRLAPVLDGPDRWGRMVAVVEGEAGGTVQAALVRAGLARVAPAGQRGTEAAALLALEAEARAAGRGLWALAHYQPQPAEALRGAVGGYRLVEGRVHRLSEGSRYLYLDLGPDWRRDLSLRLPRGQRRAFSAGSGGALDHLVGRRVRARGWVLSGFGPVIELAHPAQLELLDEPPDDAEESR